MQCGNLGRNMLTMLGGLGVGAALVYLFDPTAGRTRRSQLAKTAGDSWGNFKHRAEDSFGNLKHKAEDSWGNLKYKATHLGSAGTGLGALAGLLPRRKSRWQKMMDAYRRSFGRESLSKRAMAMRGDASHRMHDLMDWGRAKAYMGQEQLGRYYDKYGHAYGEKAKQGGSILGQTIAAIGFVALGVGIAYIMDPRAGRQRRTMMRDKMMSGMHQGQDYLSKTGRHLWNKASGTVAEVKGRLHREQVSDDVLVDRVRSEMGRCVSSPQSINVKAENGCVTLTGAIPAGEVDGLLKCVWKTRGVQEIINELNPQEQMA